MLHIFSTCPRWFDELSELPHASMGNPEDADTNAPDHLADATRYVLLHIDGGPQFVILDDPPVSLLDGLEVLEPAGNFAVRRSPVEDLFGRGDDDELAGTTQLSPFA